VDTVIAASSLGKLNFSHMSMGASAALTMLSGKHLPAVDVLSDEKEMNSSLATEK
jgi:3-phosphoglycerate kinase